MTERVVYTKVGLWGAWTYLWLSGLCRRVTRLPSRY